MKTFFIIFGLLLLSFNTHAKKFSDSEIDIYVGMGSQQYQVKDDEGKTPKNIDQYLELSSYYTVDKINRMVGSIKVIDTFIDPENSGYGLDLSGYQASFGWQKKLRLSRSFKPWVGASIAANSLDFKKRVKTDEDGFLIEQFENTEETLFTFLLHAELDYYLAPNWDAQFKLGYELGDVSGLNGAIGLKWKWR